MIYKKKSEKTTRMNESKIMYAILLITSLLVLVCHADDSSVCVNSAGEKCDAENEAVVVTEADELDGSVESEDQELSVNIGNVTNFTTLKYRKEF